MVCVKRLVLALGNRLVLALDRNDNMIYIALKIGFQYRVATLRCGCGDSGGARRFLHALHRPAQDHGDRRRGPGIYTSSFVCSQDRTPALIYLSVTAVGLSLKVLKLSPEYLGQSETLDLS